MSPNRDDGDAGVDVDEPAAAPDGAVNRPDDTETETETTPVRADDDGESEGEGDGRREVLVPLRLYKTVTVFSTLIAVVCIVLGFVLLDAAILQWTFLRRTVAGALELVGLAVPEGAISAALALAGLAVIGVGSGVYVLGSRFRAREMGNSQEDSNEDTHNG